MTQISHHIFATFDLQDGSSTKTGISPVKQLCQTDYIHTNHRGRYNLVSFDQSLLNIFTISWRNIETGERGQRGGREKREQIYFRVSLSRAVLK